MVSHSFVDEGSADDVHQHLLVNVSPWFHQWEMKLEADHRDSMIYVQEKYPTWVIVVCVLLFPIGLLALLNGRDKRQLIVTIRERENGQTEVTFAGEVPKQLKPSIEALPNG